MMQPKIFENKDNDKTEYLVAVEWIAAVDEQNAKRKAGIFHYPGIKASLDRQKTTTEFLEQEFSLSFRKLLS